VVQEQKDLVASQLVELPFAKRTALDLDLESA
jgi:hypothetical protein